MFIIEALVWVFYDWLPENAGGAFTAVVVIAAILALWRISLIVFPKKKCGRCGGAGSWGFGGMMRPCGKCGGSGRSSRIGAP